MSITITTLQIAQGDGDLKDILPSPQLPELVQTVYKNRSDEISTTTKEGGPQGITDQYREKALLPSTSTSFGSK